MFKLKALNRSIWFLLLALFIGVKSADAQYVVPTPNAVSNIQINKEVQNPQTNLFVKDLCSLNINFLPNQVVTFKVDVTNTGQTQLSNLALKDTLPPLLDFIPGGGPGTFDAPTHTLNFTIDSLNINETKSFQIKAKVKDANSLPSTGPTCLTNTAEVRVNQLFGQSTALLPVQKVLGPAQQLPVTGPEESLVILAGSLMFLVASGVLYRKSLSK